MAELPLGAVEWVEPERRHFPWWVLWVGVPLAGLAMILTPNYLKARTRGGLTACKSNLKNIATALEMYASDHKGRYPATLEGLLPENYLKAVPTCPAAGKVTYSYAAWNGKSSNFTMMCCGDNHRRAYTAFNRPSDNFPLYSAQQGLVDHP